MKQKDKKQTNKNNNNNKKNQKQKNLVHRSHRMPRTDLTHWSNMPPLKARDSSVRYILHMI